jgi:hypothetical protein
VADVLLWFAFPKGTSKRYTGDFHRDAGWHVIRDAGFDSVRQIAIDEVGRRCASGGLEHIKSRAGR